MSYVDKMPLKSKKFLAFAATQIAYTGLLIVLFATQIITFPAAFLGGIIAAGMCLTSIKYVAGQVTVDSFVDVVQSISQIGRSSELDEETYDD